MVKNAAILSCAWRRGGRGLISYGGAVKLVYMGFERRMSWADGDMVELRVVKELA